MSDESEPVRRGLLATDDAMVWAEEFCRIFNGHTIIGEAYEADKGGVPEHHVDEGTMVGWFANAMQTVLSLDRDKRRARTEANLRGTP